MDYADGLRFVNEALNDLGQTELLTGLNTEAEDPKERRCALSYDKARHTVMVAVEWNFARETTPCASVRTTMASRDLPWMTPMPGDCAQLIGAFGIHGEEPLREVIGNALYTDAPLVRIHYLRDIQDPNEWTPRAQDLLVIALAAALAKIEKGSFNELRTREELYMAALRDARKANARENRRPKEHAGGDRFKEVVTGRG